MEISRAFLRITMKKGFTLIEMIVTIGILGTVGLVVSMIFLSTLRGVTKTDIIREVKQNGDYALTVMERMIRNASWISSTVACDGSSQTSLSIQNQDGGATVFTLSSGKIASGAAFLTDDKVTVSNLFFVCNRSADKPDMVTISFTIAQAGSGTGPEGTSSINFQTSVSLRNY